MKTIQLSNVDYEMLSAIAKKQRKKEKKTSTGFTEGANKYLGMTFVTTEELDIYDSTLQHVYGDDWQVVSVDRRIPSGSEVKVVNVNGTKLEVQTVES